MPRTTTEQDTAEETVPSDVVEATEEKAAKTTKTPVGEGEVTPVDFAKLLKTHFGDEKDTPPQMIYGMLKREGFPVVDRGEGVIPRVVIKRDEALQWVATSREKTAARKAAKAEADAAKAAKAEAPSES